MELTQNNDGSYALYVVNYKKVSQSELEEDFGEIGSHRLVTFPHNDNAIVKYNDYADALSCIEKMKNSKKYKVRPAENKSKSLHVNTTAYYDQNESSQRLGSHDTFTEPTINNCQQSKLDRSYIDALEKLSLIEEDFIENEKSFLYICNLPSNTITDDINELLADFDIDDVIGLYTTKPEQPIKLKYAVVEMNHIDAVKAMKKLDSLKFNGKTLMVKEINEMYLEATAPLRNGENPDTKAPTIEEIQNSKIQLDCLETDSFKSGRNFHHNQRLSSDLF